MGLNLLTRRIVFGLAVMFVACTCGVFDVGAATNNAPAAPRKALLDVVPQAVTSGTAQRIGPLSGIRRMKLAISLPVRNQSDLDDLIAQLYDATSPSFHQYLSVDEFTARFGPTQADYDGVVAWAKAQGFDVTNTPRNRRLVDVEGSVATVNRAFNVTMTSYQAPTDKHAFFSPDREPTAALSVQLLAISGLDNFTPPQRRMKHGDVPLLGPIGKPRGSAPDGEFLPSDMRTVYYGSGPLTGAGQTVGIFSFDGYKTSDVQLFFSSTGTSSSVPIRNVLVNGFSGACGDGGAGCNDGEQVLDIVNVLGVAPGITQVLFYEGDSGPDILNQMATDNIAKVISCSWGSGDMGTATNPIFLEFQAQGQTFASATGDDGAYNPTNGNHWLPPSLNPYILQVGGTSLVTSDTDGSWVSETTWPDGGGGFFSGAGYAIPTWQIGLNNLTNKGSATYRNDPDVAAEADFDNPTVSNGQFLGGFGGTSFAAPRWAGLIALANEQSVANGDGVVGFVNAKIHDVGVGANYTSNFHDITTGNNGSANRYPAVPGYDLATGWGSPQGATLIDSLAGPLTTPGYSVAAYPTRALAQPGGGATSSVTIATPNGFTGSVALSAAGLPSGVTATFNPPSATTSTPSVLTLTADNTVAPGTAAAVTVVGTSGAMTQTATVNLLVGDAPSATVTPSPVTFTAVPLPLGPQDRDLIISNGPNSVPLTYAIAAFGSSDGSCTGAASWLSLSVDGGEVTAGKPTHLVVAVDAPSAIAGNSTAAELCVTTSDPNNASIVVPVTMIPGPSQETIFRSGFESGENGSANIVTFTINEPVENDQAGSSLDLVTGNYHTWNSVAIDNINLYNDGTGLQVYWYDDVLTGTIATKVGGVASASNYSVLQEGALVGPTATFVRSTSAMTNWFGGVDGFIGIAFRNSKTGTLNYGYIHVVTNPLFGFPAQVLDYAFDPTGAAIVIQ